MLRIKTKNLDLPKPEDLLKVGIIDVACCGLRHCAAFRSDIVVTNPCVKAVGIIDVACCGLRLRNYLIDCYYIKPCRNN